MTRTHFIIALAAASALAGCNSGDNTIVAGGPDDPMANLTNESGPVELPPAIVASHQYRCKDNSLISIDWLSDGTTNTARVTPEGGTATTVTQAEADGDYTAEGATLAGGPQSPTVTYNGKSCKQ